jgi:IcmF-related N-terminal domain
MGPGQAEITPHSFTIMPNKKRTANIPRPRQPEMEVYTASHGTSWIYDALPSPLTSFYGLLMAGSISGLAYFIGDTWGGGAGAFWSIIAISVMTVISLVLLGFRARRAKNEAREEGEGFETALRNSTAGWDDNVSDPAEIARQDELRKKFLKGIQIFHEHGRDLYSLPWYVIVGEPGCGKTEAIRRSELRFPEALHDTLQGTGGTYSMDWWFTNQAIILDTAGAMLMQPEASARFESFLKLLRENRPACPINGMILTIPTDSLLSDPPVEAEQKARVIATQLAMIQKALDVRFPIYLMISKSDRLPGFREFFDMEGQSKYERQMMGWANPAPLGEPFSADTIYQAIDAISSRLQNRALALLADPVPPNPDLRRADEVDAVYAFPQFIRTLAPRLKLYLDVIFQTGVWVAKPPFFRGIFFTTAVREGAQLDVDLAKQLGVKLNMLPHGIFERKKSAFLRDFFLEKIFPEKGLVTKLFDVGAHLRKRLTTFYGATAALLALGLGFAWLVKDRIEAHLQEEQTMWASANATWQNGTFLRVIGRSSHHSDQIPDRPRWYLAKREGSGVDSKRPADVLDELAKIHDRVHEKIGLSWVFLPVPEWRDFLERRRLGYLTLFEGAVMKPVIDAARERILWDVAPGNTTMPETQLHLTEAYRRLLELETWAANERSIVTHEQWERWFLGLLTYITDPAPPGGVPANFSSLTSIQGDPAPEKHVIDRLAKDLAKRTFEVYSTEVKLSARRWMSESEGLAESALAKGADFIFGKTRSEASSNDQNRAELAERTKSALDNLKRAEEHLITMAEKQPQGPRHVIEQEGLNPLHDALNEYRRIADSNSSHSAQNKLGMDVVEATAKAILLTEDGIKDAPGGLHHAAALAKSMHQAANSGSTAGPEDAEGIWAAANKRFAAYQDSFAPLRSIEVGMSLGYSVGNLLQKLQEVTEHVKSASVPTAPSNTPDKPADKATEKQEKICAYLQKFRGTPLISEVFRNYEQELRTRLNQALLFPLVQRADNASYSNILAFEFGCKELAKVEKDMLALPQMSAPLYQCPERVPVEELFKKLEAVVGIKNSLLKEDSSAKGKGLVIVVDAVQPAKTISKQTETNDSSVQNGNSASGAPKASVIESIQEGFVQIRILVSGTLMKDGAPDGASCEIPYDGIGPVSIALTFARPPPASASTFPYSSPQGNWALLREMAVKGKNRFAIGDSGKFFTLKSNPSLPVGQWPQQKDFMPK